MSSKSKGKFRETEIGMIPEDWEVRKIAELGNPKEVVLTGPFGSLLHASDYAEEGVPLLLVNSIEEGKLSKKDIPKVNKRKAEELKRFWLKEGDIVFSRVGVVGRTLYIDKEKEGWMFSGQTLRIRLNSPKVYNRFIDYYFRCPSAVNLSENTSLGTTRPSINTSILANRKIPLPPILEQKSITEILSSLDSKIELNQEMNAALEKIGQALFKHWFIDFEFPNEKGKPYKSSGGKMVDSELGEIPRAWQVKKVGEVIDIFGGTTPSTKEPKYWQGGTIHWATPKDLSGLDSPVLIDTERKITPQGLATISSGLLPAGTVLLSSRAPIGYTAISQMPVSINQGFIAMVCNHELPNYYVFSWAQFNLDIIKSVASGTTFEEVNKSNFRRLDILVPPSGLLSEFSTIFGSLYECILNNSFQARTLLSVRDSLLPRLMSGQIRVPEG